MAEQVQLTEDEVQSIKQLREQVVSVISSIGQVKITMELFNEELQALETKISEQVATYKSLLEQEKVLINGLLDKYGVGSLDIDTGIFTPEK